MIFVPRVVSRVQIMIPRPRSPVPDPDPERDSLIGLGWTSYIPMPDPIPHPVELCSLSLRLIRLV
jgi:hypothetical protein